MNFLFGNNPQKTDMIFIFLGALCAFCFSFLFTRGVVSFYLACILSFVYADLVGGIISNFTSSTTKFYTHSRYVQCLFVSVHLIYPALMYWIFPMYGKFFLFVACYMFIAANFCIALPQKYKANSALLLFCIGVLCCFYFTLTLLFLYSFSFLLFLKIIGAFSSGSYLKAADM